MKKLFLLLSAFALTFSSLAQTKLLLNLNKAGLALQGYDPVAFFTDNRAIKGKPEFKSIRANATYQFASREHKELFDKDPAKYDPAFGGYCAYGVSRNKLVEIDVDASQIVDGLLLLQYSKGVRNDFNKNTKGNLAKAENNWPQIVEKKGK